jgi:hypothetical protein
MGKRIDADSLICSSGRRESDGHTEHTSSVNGISLPTD